MREGQKTVLIIVVSIILIFLTIFLAMVYVFGYPVLSVSFILVIAIVYGVFLGFRPYRSLWVKKN